MTISVIANRYANAFADVVAGPRSTLSPQQALAELRAFEAVLNESHDLHQSLINPAVPGSRKKAVLGRIAGLLGLSAVSRNFLFVLIDHRRMAQFSAIVRDFEAAMDRRMGYARAEVSSATQLTPEQEEALGRELERVTGKRIRTRFGVEPALIGGAVARIGSTVYDGSVRGRLAALERRLIGQDKR